MLVFSQRTDQPATDVVELTYDARKRSRLKVVLASGREAGLFVERGSQLVDGDRLLAETGEAVVEIRAAEEDLVEVQAATPADLMRAAYHLGNRHVPVQIVADPGVPGGGRLRFQTDPVLAAMLVGLGCPVHPVRAPFQPESGAYGGGHAHHGHGEDDASQAGAARLLLHNPGHGSHRSVPRIHAFEPAAEPR